MMKNKILFLASLLFIVQLPAINAQEKSVLRYKNTEWHESYKPTGKCDNRKVPKNIILMIGDGMGLTHIASGMYANHNQLSIANIPTIGLVKTQSGNRFTTDSAASGTAYATGQKTHNGAIGVDSTDKPVKNIPEILNADLYVSGVVTTDNLSGATPSAFFAHQPDRGMSKEILAELPGSPLIFVAGGSDRHFEKERPSYQQILSKHQFTVINDYQKVARHINADKIALIACQKDVTSKVKGRGDFLPVTTQNAISFLNAKQRKGFFLMVEGAQIDKRAHENDFEGIIREVLDFDEAVAEALKFADENGETLVIITADHETGGLSIKNGDIDTSQLEGNFSTKGHTPVMVPLFAYGPSSEQFKGVMENNELMIKIVSLLK